MPIDNRGGYLYKYFLNIPEYHTNTVFDLF